MGNLMLVLETIDTSTVNVSGLTASIYQNQNRPNVTKKFQHFIRAPSRT